MNGLTVIAGDVLTLSQMAPMGVLVIEPDLIFSLPDEPPPADGRRDVDLAIPQHTLHPSLAAEGLYLRPGLPIPDAQRSQAVRPRAAASALPKSGFHCR